MNNVDSKNIKFALDVGTRSIIGSVGIVENDKLKVICERYLEHEERAMIDGQIHDIELVAKSVKKIVDDIELELGIKLDNVSIAAAGRFLKTINSEGKMELNSEEEIKKEDIRNLEMIALKEAECEINKTTDGKLYCVGYSVKNYYLNGFVISNLIGHKGENVSVEVIATFLPRSVIDSLYTVMKKVGLRVSNLTLEPIAAIEAVVPKNLRLLNIALVDIGAGTSDIAISSKESISSYGMVPQAGDEVTEAVVQECLVDFNTAEYIKRNLDLKEEITYTDIIGFENTIKSENIKKIIRPVVKKIAEGISSKIIELNGNKSPSALFLVGGGAHTPWMIEELSEKLNIPVQRIAIKDRKAVVDCISDNNLGSAGVTVLGIALIALKNGEKDFIDVILNGTPVSMFNSHNHTIMDVIIQAGINPSMLIGKNGKNLRYKLNGVKRIAFGEKGKNPTIRLNDKIESMDKKVKDGDIIEIAYAVLGKDARPKVIEQIKEFNSISIYINDELINLEPMIIVNNEIKSIDYYIQEDDDINIIFPKSIKDIKEYIIKEDVSLEKDGVQLLEDYIVNEGDKLISYRNISFKDMPKGEINKDANKEEVQVNDDKKNLSSGTEIEVTFNDKLITLSGQKDYIFVDIFNYIDFDLKEAKGIINLLLNGNKVGYTEKLKDGDNIQVFWS
ncbi:rod shape-determining protein [Clostridium tertium]|jgi:cell division protein FtsA|uniref:Rod shape-determining protein n=1 Tax=Clostridium tertium TaxID=1559 RepID=A0A9X3XSD2_9CLOT|nr:MULTISPECIES: cell division FtsA domain-containing protein [Clostridium]EEH99065.1 cell division protein FtsA [Clostridium sp. 7_2_43FAA]MBP1867803.1 cell division protein FtsA [Clostridium tertium]MBU6137039.1 rod shape-determining protein [Clostridium tertium]MDB1921401.1 rod shape-determining protein [Clostridium tertium]MDB1924646.1 rod shape-determining protein [Clostridium tertium]